MEPYVHDAVVDMQIAREQLRGAFDALEPGDWSRYVPYGSRKLHDVLSHVAAADQVWAVAAQGLLKGDGEERPPISEEDAHASAQRALRRGQQQTVAALLEEMERRRSLLTGLLGLLEKRHLAMRLPAFGARHNSVRERIWVGYHDRLHGADVRRALAMTWHPGPLSFLREIDPAVRSLAPGETLYVIYSVDPVYWERRVFGLDWSFRQLLAHIATGDWVLQAQLRHVIEEGSVMAWPDVTAGNAERITQRAFSTEARLTDEYVSMRHETMLLLSQLKPKHLRLPLHRPWLPEPNHGTLLDYVDGFPAHERAHREQLRAAMKFQTSARA